MGHGDDERSVREALVLGEGPRIPPLSSDQAVQAAVERTARLREAVTGSTGPVDPSEVPELLLSLMCHPQLYDCLGALSVQLLAKGTLTARDRELAILRTSWLCTDAATPDTTADAPTR